MCALRSQLSILLPFTQAQGDIIIPRPSPVNFPQALSAFGELLRGLLLSSKAVTELFRPIE